MSESNMDIFWLILIYYNITHFKHQEVLMFHTVKLSKSDPTPLYIQLACELAKLIQADLLCEGMKLPTIRLLSKQLSINRDTVVSAYKLLEQQGLVESHIGKGTYIAPRTTSTNIPLSPITSSKPRLCCSHLNLSHDFYPETLCQELTHRIITKEGWEAFDDPFFRQRHALRQSTSAFLETLGLKVHFAQTRIISSMDTFLLSLFKLSPKIGVCVEHIRDLSLSCYLRSIGAKIYEIPLNHDGIDLDVLEKYLHTGTISYIFVSPYLQNPTGICYTESTKQKLLELASRYDAYIVEDGTYCDFLYDTTHYKPLNNLCTDGRVIYLYHFSKVYLPYMKYSFAILPSTLMKRFKDDIECSFNERFLHYYLISDDLSRIRLHIHSTCKLRYQTLLSKLNILDELISYTDYSGGLSLWCHISETASRDFFETLTSKDIIVAPGELFSTTSLKDYFRLSISELPTENIDELILTLKKCLLPTYIAP